jgi:flagellar hook-length control protein FliK
MQLQSKVESRISLITSQQVASIPQDNGVLKWITSLPFQWGDRVVEIDVDIQQHPRSSVEDQEEWQLVLSFELDALGCVKVNIGMVDERLQIHFFVEDESLSRLEESLPQLRSQLAMAGLQIDRLSSSISNEDQRLTMAEEPPTLDICV